LEGGAHFRNGVSEKFERIFVTVFWALCEKFERWCPALMRGEVLSDSRRALAGAAVWAGANGLGYVVDAFRNGWKAWSS
jgi:hypothetical protein